MERKLQVECPTLAEAAEFLAGLADRLAEGTLEVEETGIRVTAPVSLAVELDVSHTSARATIAVQCHRPDGGSRLLQEELARPGG